MPTKAKPDAANYRKAFPSRMRELLRITGTTQKELAAHLAKSAQAISYYCDGSSSPDWETVAEIAKFFHVSADYLLGISDCATVNIKSYGDVINVLLAMEQQGAISIIVNSPQTFSSDLQAATTSFQIPCYECNRFLVDYRQMFDLYAQKTISAEAFRKWCGAELAALQELRLPEIYVQKNGKWVLKEAESQSFSPSRYEE